ncbi:MAG TPA: S-layer homology domain-containing protein [Bacillota bacterium]|nr:S-layer homology domain-containing protein [Bacillota bacterium]
MVTRALAYSGKAVSLTPAEVDALLARFSDIAQIGDWAREAVAVAVKEGIVHGRAADLYDPGSNATRAEAVVMLKRMLTSTGAL